MLKKAWAVWKGGTISTERGVLKEAPYGFKAPLENGKGTNRKSRSAPASSLPQHPIVSARIPGTDNAKLQEIANKAKTGCPVSKLLKAQITMDAKLKA